MNKSPKSEVQGAKGPGRAPAQISRRRTVAMGREPLLADLAAAGRPADGGVAAVL